MIPRSDPVLDVVAGVLRRGRSVLVCQRKLSSSHGGKWEFPGGKVEPGESPDVALRRELWEELGIEAVPGQALWETTHQYPGGQPLRLAFRLVPRWTGPITNRVFEDVRWVVVEALAGLDFLDADREFVEQLAAGRVRLAAR